MAHTRPANLAQPRERPALRAGLALLELLAAVAVCALAVGGLILGARTAPRYPVDLTIKEPETRLELANFHIPESNDEFRYRWSRPYAFVQLQNAARLAPGYLVSVRLRVPAPDPNRRLAFLADERPLAEVVPTPQFRTYRLALPASRQAGALRVALSAPELRLPGDARPLGVVLTGAEFAALREAPPALLAVAGIGLLLLWGALRLSGSRRWAAGLICATLGAATAALWAASGPMPLAPEWLAGAGLLGAGAAALLAREAYARLGLGLLSALVGWSGALRPSWLMDDAFISFRYAQNLVAGHGLVYNIGERVEGYTNFLWTLLSALVLWLGGDIVWWSYAAGVLLALAIVLATFALARATLGPGWGLAAALIAGTSQSLLIHTARGAGLETGLFALLALLGSLAYLRALGRQRTAKPQNHRTTEPQNHRTTEPQNHEQRTKNTTRESRRGGADRIAQSPNLPISQSSNQPPATSHQPSSIVYRPSSHLLLPGLLFGLATLTRPEGALLFGLTCAHLLVIHSWAGLRQARRQGAQALSAALRSLVPLLLAYALIVVPFFLWRYSYYGDLLPNTFYAKTGGGALAFVRGLQYAAGFALALGGPLLLLTLAPLLPAHQPGRQAQPGAVGDSGALRREPYSASHGYLLLLCGAYTLYIISVGGDHFPGERFFVPLVPWLAALLAGGLAWAYGWLRATPLRRLAPALLAALLAGYAAYAYTRAPEQDAIVAGSDESLQIWRELGWWLADNTAADQTVAAMSAGAIAYYSERTTIDMLGLTDRHIARVAAPAMGAGPAGHEKRDPAYVLDVRRPTYIPQMWEDYFGGAEALRGRYQLITITTRYGRTLAMWKVVSSE